MEGGIFEMKRFEYKAVAIHASLPITAKHYEQTAQKFEARLNSLGADGWELVQCIDGFFFFKRELE